MRTGTMGAMHWKVRLSSVALAAAVFLAPLNLFLKWQESTAYVGGIFTDYLVPKFWIGEIPVLVILALWLPTRLKSIKKNSLKHWWPVLLLTATFIARQLTTPLPMVSGWYLVKLIELVLFGWCFASLWPTLNHRLIRLTVLSAILLQASLATFQFVAQRSLFAYEVLGETRLTYAINIARAQFATGEKIVPYGTTAHPNILAGVMVVLGVWWLQQQSNILRKKRALVLVAIISWVLFLTQAYSAIFAWVLYALWQSFPRLRQFGGWVAALIVITGPLLIATLPPNWQTPSTLRRNLLSEHAAQVWTQAPWGGTGLGLFTTTLHNPQQQVRELVRFIQPVHHVPLLILAETGVIGAGLLYFGWQYGRSWLTKNAHWLVILAPLLAFDHYLVTQWVGGFCLTLIASASLALPSRKTRELESRGESE